VTLQERLRRLRRDDGPAPGAGLDALEADLVGTTGEGLSLKERLQRLVDVASRGRAPARRAVPLEELVPGRVVRNERGEFFLVEHELHLETWHGDLSLSRVNAVSPGSVEVLSGEPSLAGFDLRRAAFLDTETTGLAGGTGTAAFLVGVGFVDGDVFRVRQYFMRDYHEEPALLQALAEDLARFPCLVTYNGKMFDMPLLETRYRLCRQAPPLAEALHLDLLHPARRLWKARLESCRLQSLEDALLGLRRHGDVPGEEIPRIYFDYVRSRAAGVVPRILEHNRLDIVSLAALSILACQWVEEGWAEDPRDVYSLARVLERARLYERSEAGYRRTAEAGEGALRVAAQMRLAARAWRGGDEEAAAELWRQAADAGEPLALRALAVDLEHRRRDPAGAFGHVERALHLLERRGSGGRFLVEMRRRRERLLRKLEALAETPRRP
jgi:uncharacterized protein YprB with RNaseH-like and TPR domain